MKNYITAFLLTLLILNETHSQGLSGKCVIHLTMNKLVAKKGAIRIKIYNQSLPAEDKNYILFDSTTAKGSLNFTIKIEEPLITNILFFEKDSILFCSSALILTNREPVNIIFSEKLEIKISGEENNFYHDNVWLYLKVPYTIIGNYGFKVEWIKRRYELYFPESNELYWKYQEFENSAYKSVYRNRNLLFNIMRLYGAKEAFSQKMLEKCYAVIPENLKKSYYGKLLKEYISNTNKLFPGMDMPDFIITDSLKKIINSSQLVNPKKILILDFWASWCVPCREKMQYLKELYKQLDTNKVAIISIAVFDKHDKWIKANNEENLPWQSYLDKSDNTLSAERKFTLNSIPYNFIIDKNKKIIEKNIWNEELLEFLKQQNLLIKKENLP